MMEATELKAAISALVAANTLDDLHCTVSDGGSYGYVGIASATGFKLTAYYYAEKRPLIGIEFPSTAGYSLSRTRRLCDELHCFIYLGDRVKAILVDYRDQAEKGPTP